MNVLAERLRSVIAMRIAQKRYRSRAAVARALGIDPGRLGHYATDTREPDIQMLLAICRELRTHPNYLLGYSDDPEPTYPNESTKLSKLEGEIRELKQLMRRAQASRE